MLDQKHIYSVPEAMISYLQIVKDSKIIGLGSQIRSHIEDSLRCDSSCKGVPMKGKRKMVERKLNISR